MKFSTVDFRKLDPDFKDRVLSTPGGDSVKLCYSCGACTGVCPAAELGVGFSPSRIARQVLWGMKKEVLGGHVIWYCLGCHRCYLRCPQGVRFADVVEILREMAVEEGYADEGMPARVRAVEELLKRLRKSLVEEAVKEKEPDLAAAARSALEGDE